MFKYLARLKYDQAAEVKIFAQELTICGQIWKEFTRSKYAGMAKWKGWLVDIDFAKLPDRIVLMKDELDKLLMVAQAKENYYCWEFLTDELKNFDLLVEALANLSVVKTSIELTESFRPG